VRPHASFTGALDGAGDHGAGPAGGTRRHSGRHEDNRRADRLTNKTKSLHAADIRREDSRVHSEARPLLAARRIAVPFTPALSRGHTMTRSFRPEVIPVEIQLRTRPLGR